jgi:integrase
MAPKHHITVSEAVEEFLHFRAARFASSTVTNQGYVLRRFAAFLERDIQLRNLTESHVEDFFSGANGVMRQHVTRDGLQREPVAPSTHNYYRKTMDVFFEHWTRRGVVRRALLREVTPMRVPRQERLQPSPEQLLAMIEGAANSRDRALLAAAANTALRRHELLSIRVGDLDLAAYSMKVVISKSGDYDNVAITSDLGQHLADWLRTYALDIGRPLTDHDYLFPARHGSRYAWTVGEGGKPVKGRVEATWNPAKPLQHPERIVQYGLSRLGLPVENEGMHTIRRAAARHFFDMLMAQGQYDHALRTTSAFLHHKNSSTTEHYLGLSSERIRRDQVLRGRPFLSDMVQLADVVQLHPDEERPLADSI